jgi:hypothetical protein
MDGLRGEMVASMYVPKVTVGSSPSDIILSFATGNGDVEVPVAIA